MSEQNQKEKFKKSLEEAQKALNCIMEYRAGNNGQPLDMGVSKWDYVAHMLAVHVTGSENASMWPLQHGDGGYSSSFMLIHPTEGFCFIKTDPVEENGKLIPENGILRLPGGFHFKRGRYSPWVHAVQKFYENMGLNIYDTANIHQLRKIVTEYPAGAPLGQLHNPRRSATTFIGYVDDKGLEALYANPKGQQIEVLYYTDFKRQALRAVNGKPSMLSRLPQQCHDFLYHFRDGINPKF